MTDLGTLDRLVRVSIQNGEPETLEERGTMLYDEHIAHMMQ